MPKMLRASRCGDVCFADDAILATTEIAMKEFVSVATDFGLKVSFQKTKLMVSGRK